MQLCDFLPTCFHLLPQHPVLRCQHINHVLGPGHHGIRLPHLQMWEGLWQRKRSRLNWQLGLQKCRYLEWLLLAMSVLLLMVKPWRWAVRIQSERLTPLRCLMTRSWWERLCHWVGACSLGTTRAHNGKCVSMALWLLVRNGRMWWMGGWKDAAEGRGLGTRQRANRGDGGRGAVLVQGSLVVNRTLFGGSEETQAMWLYGFIFSLCWVKSTLS